MSPSHENDARTSWLAVSEVLNRVEDKSILPGGRQTKSYLPWHGLKRGVRLICEEGLSHDEMSLIPA